MLETVKQTIADLPDITFDEYFMNYVMSVQDRNIQLESASVFRNVSPDIKNVLSADRLVQKNFERLVR